MYKSARPFYHKTLHLPIGHRCVITFPGLRFIIQRKCWLSSDTAIEENYVPDVITVKYYLYIDSLYVEIRVICHLLCDF